MLKDIVSRIELRLKIVGKSASAASEQAGLSKDAIRNWKRKIRDGIEAGLANDSIQALAPVLETSANWLLTGDGPQTVGTIKKVIEPDSPYSEPNGGNIPEYDVRAQAGSGGYSGEIYCEDEFGNQMTRPGVVASWLIPDQFLKGELRAAVGETSIIEVNGDSNVPIINSGDRLIIDLRKEQAIPDTLYLIDYGFGPAIKRLSPVAESDPPQCDIVSYNPNVPTQRVSMETIEIIGRVIGRIHRM